MQASGVVQVALDLLLAVQLTLVGVAVGLRRGVVHELLETLLQMYSAFITHVTPVTAT